MGSVVKIIKTLPSQTKRPKTRKKNNKSKRIKSHCWRTRRGVTPKPAVGWQSPKWPAGQPACSGYLDQEGDRIPIHICVCMYICVYAQIHTQIPHTNTNTNTDTNMAVA